MEEEDCFDDVGEDFLEEGDDILDEVDDDSSQPEVELELPLDEIDANESAMAIYDGVKKMEAKNRRKRIRKGICDLSFMDKARISGRALISKLSKSKKSVDTIEQYVWIHSNMISTGTDSIKHTYFDFILLLNSMAKDPERFSSHRKKTPIGNVFAEFKIIAKKGIWSLENFADAVKSVNMDRERAERPYIPKHGVKCRHCGSTETVSVDVRLRGADEGDSKLTTCLRKGCGKVTRDN